MTRKNAIIKIYNLVDIPKDDTTLKEFVDSIYDDFDKEQEKIFEVAKKSKHIFLSKCLDLECIAYWIEEMLQDNKMLRELNNIYSKVRNIDGEKR